MRGTGWVSKAPCAGDPRFTPDNPSLDVLKALQCANLLRVCDDCPFRAACISLVLPRGSKFDGICGGRLWLDGQIRDTCQTAHPDELGEGNTPIIHGTEAGARAHNRRGERACSLCREAGRLAQARRRQHRRVSGQQAIPPKNRSPE